MSLERNVLPCARARRERWFVPGEISGGDEARISMAAPADRNPEGRLIARERRGRIAAAIDRLDGRQRTVFMLCHYADCTPREVSAMTGLNESTVRVTSSRTSRMDRTRSAPPMTATTRTRNQSAVTASL